MTQRHQTSSIALVTTVWLASASNAHDAACTAPSRHADVLSAFLLYHLAIGVTKIFVFFDGDERSQLRVVELHPHVQAHCAAGCIELRYRSSAAGNSPLRELYERHCVTFSRFRDTMESDVAARQMLNAELAMDLCRQHNRELRAPHTNNTSGLHQWTEPESSHATIDELRWLLHLDIDELLYLDAFAVPGNDPTQALSDYVRNLEQQHHAHQMTLLNYEAIPTQLYGANYFATATKFRRHHARIPLTRDAQQRLAFWQQRTRHQQFFLFYDNGKSMVRVSDEGNFSSIPASVHHWQLSASESSTSGSIRTSSKTNFHDARRNFIHENVVLEQRGQQACILHYPVCGLEWLGEKYERLGKFADVWGGTSGERVMQIRPCFHTQARDALQGKAPPSDAMRALYESHVMLDMDAHTHEWQRQVATGVCEEIDFVARMLLGSLGFSRHAKDTQPTQDSPVAAATLQQADDDGDDEDESGDSGASSSPAPASASSKSFTTEKAWMLASISSQYL